MDELMAAVRRDEDIPLERRIRFRFDSANAVVKCVAAVDALFAQSGGRAIFLASPILRYFLDAHAARAHHANGPDKPGKNLGGVLLGLKNQDFFL
jgi:3-hydroxy-9,10-secoandrosta-1,3,5(10)-triene-9,17-dione monooxygenase